MEGRKAALGVRPQRWRGSMSQTKTLEGGGEYQSSSSSSLETVLHKILEHSDFALSYPGHWQPVQCSASTQDFLPASSPSP